MQDKDFIPGTANLTLGDEGGDVERLQRYLKKFGYMESQSLEMFGAEAKGAVGARN